MDSQRQQQWRDIQTVTEQLHALAEAEEWEAMLALYHRRDELIYAYFAEAVGEEEVAFLRKAIPELQTQNNALQRLCAIARDELGRRMGQVSLGRKAEAAYHQNR